MNNETYQAGIARADITPPVGIRLCGYAVREGLSQRIDEPLTTTALMLRARGTMIVLLGLDLALASIEFTRQVRKQCARVLGIPTENVLANYSHTHSSPVMPGWAPYDVPEQLEMQSAYGQHVIAQSEKACREAAENLRPARLAVDWGECRGNINRRQKAADETVLLGEDPSGPCDSSVGVIRCDDLQGRPLALAFRYSCHPVTLGPRTNVISPDFVGPARSLLESQLGCLSVFLQGCAGNLNPISGIGQDSTGREDTVRLGQMVAGEVLKVCGTLRTHRKRAQPKLIRSVATYWLYEYEQVPPGDEGSIRVQTVELELPLKPFPALPALELERKDWAAKLAAARANHAPESQLNVVTRFEYWSQQRLAAAKQATNPLTIKFLVQVFQIGDLAIVGIPFEPMAETGLGLRLASRRANTFVLGYSNGVISYLPTPQVSSEGGMEARLGYINYLVPSEILGNWEQIIQQTILKLLNSYE